MTAEAPLSASGQEGRSWASGAVVYQVYPRSFADSDGDGVGDLDGATSRLPYLADVLSVDAIWLSPVYRSPMRDFGYDITSFTEVDPLFGDLAAFDRFVGRAHDLGLRVIMDFVPNHTSDAHPWFVDSATSRVAEHADWYVWADPAPGRADPPQPPNNWRAVTGGSAWRWVSQREQFVLHSFLPFQPDLDLSHPPAREAIHDAMRFWLDRGVDGLRVDMVDFLAKDPLLRDEPDEHYRFADAEHHLDRQRLPEVLRGFRDVVTEYPDRVLVGEVNPDLSIEETVALHGTAEDPLLDMPFNFGLLRTPFTADALAAHLDAYDRAVPAWAWPNLTLGNHDVSRLASRLGQAGARSAAVLLLTARATTFLYNGDELGLTDVDIPPELVQDPWEARTPGRGRDRNRSPLPWDDSPPAAGFSATAPWLPVGAANSTRTVTRQRQDPDSMLSLYSELLRLRRSHPVLLDGAQRADNPQPDLLRLHRQQDHPKPASLVILVNTADADTVVEPSHLLGHRRPLLCSGPAAWQNETRTLRARSAVVLR
ncbi:alpha-amylase family glycosyl hydrolase [Jannaschia sp. R86511]|uniref:alpha-amylase family glycosyl hydrolase n=1 Tax=Jannaschia sp. R86511 TaxID=3093853 RepID=UPI0036D3E135